MCGRGVWGGMGVGEEVVVLCVGFVHVAPRQLPFPSATGRWVVPACAPRFLLCLQQLFLLSPLTRPPTPFSLPCPALPVAGTWRRWGAATRCPAGACRGGGLPGLPGRGGGPLFPRDPSRLPRPLRVRSCRQQRQRQQRWRSRRQRQRQRWPLGGTVATLRPPHAPPARPQLARAWARRP